MTIHSARLCQVIDSRSAANYAPSISETPLLAALKRAGRRLARARADVDELIVKAAAEGHSLRVLAEAAGVSHERVRQLLQRRSNDR
jgi:DNA-directed RNA polymerase sigma subunit (sigma70/sigma32)